MTDSFEQISAHNEELARDIVERASARGVTVSTAESLTAGMDRLDDCRYPGRLGGAAWRCGDLLR